jgi:hypothetical protein
MARSNRSSVAHQQRKVPVNPSVNVQNTLPTPRRAVTELPDPAAVGAAGIELSVEQARLVLCVVSRLAGRGRSKTRMTLYNTILGLVFMGRQSRERNGLVQPALFPDLPVARWPQGSDVFRRLGITNRHLEQYWASTRPRADDACLPLPWALAFFPALIWPMIASVIELGPEQANVLMQAAVADMAQTTTQRHRRRRPSGSPLALATIENRITGVWQLLGCLLELRSLAATSPVLPVRLLDAWTVVPPRPDARALGACEAGQDNTGPAVDACSTQLKLLAADARASTARNGYIKRRRAIFLGLLCLFGPRADALRTVRVEDFLPDHRFPDGTHGPVLRIYPAKTWAADVAHHLPLPDELAGWIRDWITFTDRELGQPQEPLFPSRKPKQPGITNQFLTAHGFYSAVAGAHQTHNTGSRPLLPIDDSDPYIGWRTHGYRHTAFQLAMQAATALQRQNPLFFPHVHPEEFAKALVGHHLVADVGAIYRDLDRERLSRAVVGEMWRVLYDQGVIRRGADPTRVRQAREHRDLLAITIHALREDMRNNEAHAERFTNRAQTTRATDKKLECLLEAANAHSRVNASRTQLHHLEAELEAAHAAFDRAVAEPVPVPSDRSDAEQARLLAEALGDAPPQPVLTAVAMADEITVAEATKLWDTSEQTINRWHRSGPPRNRPLPWLGGRDAWVVYNGKDKRLRVDAINNAALTPEQEQLLATLRGSRALDQHLRAADALDPSLELVIQPTAEAAPNSGNGTDEHRRLEATG